MRAKPRSSVYQRQSSRPRVRGDQQIVAAHRLTALFEIGTQPAIDYVDRRLERQHVKRPENRVATHFEISAPVFDCRGL